MPMSKLWKTVVTIWSDEDPSDLELEDLARDATNGDSICTTQISKEVDADTDPDMRKDVREFFNLDGAPYKVSDMWEHLLPGNKPIYIRFCWNHDESKLVSLQVQELGHWVSEEGWYDRGWWAKEIGETLEANDDPETGWQWAQEIPEWAKENLWPA